MVPELKILAFKFMALLVATPFMGWGIMLSFEKIETAWKTRVKKKKWLASCSLFMVLAFIGKWLH